MARSNSSRPRYSRKRGAHPGRPEQCDSRSLRVTCVRSSPLHWPIYLLTGSSTPMLPRSVCCMTIGVVASTLVSEARSKIVSSPTRDDGSSNVRVPNASRQSGRDASPTSTTAPGNALASAACAITRAAEGNMGVGGTRQLSF